MTNPPVPATPLDVEAPLKTHAVQCIEEGRPQDWWLFKAMTPEGKVSNGQPVDVEACVRLLREAADLFAERARSAEPWEAAASNLKSATMNVLALALPGMGKDSERLDWLASFDAVTITEGADGHEVAVMRLGVPVAIGATLRGAIDRGFTLKPLRSAARAAQPKETSADAK